MDTNGSEIMGIEQQIRDLHAAGTSKIDTAKSIGVSLNRLEWMLSTMKFEWKRQSRGGSYVIDDIRDTLHGHAKRLGVSVATIRWRLKRNQDLVAPPVHNPITRAEAKLFVELREAGTQASAAAKQVGRPYNSLKEAAVRFFPDNKAVTARRSRQQVIAGLSLVPAPSSQRVTKEEAQLYVKLRKSGMPAWAAASKVGKTYKSLRDAAAKFCPEYKSTKVRRSPEQIMADNQNIAA
jgi:lambda repressor-like predicted transcriptional regulator